MKTLLFILTFMLIGLASFSQQKHFQYKSTTSIVTQYNEKTEDYDLVKKDTDCLYTIATKVGCLHLTNVKTGSSSEVTFETQAFDKKYDDEGGFTYLYKGTLASGTKVIVMYSFTADENLNMIIIAAGDLNKLVAYGNLSYLGEK